MEEHRTTYRSHDTYPNLIPLDKYRLSMACSGGKEKENYL